MFWIWARTISMNHIFYQEQRKREEKRNPNWFPEKTRNKTMPWQSKWFPYDKRKFAVKHNSEFMGVARLKWDNWAAIRITPDGQRCKLKGRARPKSSSGRLHTICTTVFKQSDEEFCKEVIPGRQNQSKAGELSHVALLMDKWQWAPRPMHRTKGWMNDSTRVSLSNTMPQKRNLIEGTALLHLNASSKGRADREAHLMRPVGKQGRLAPGGLGLFTWLHPFCFVYSDFTSQVHANRKETKVTELFPKPCQFWVQSDVFNNSTTT